MKEKAKRLLSVGRDTADSFIAKQKTCNTRMCYAVIIISAVIALHLIWHVIALPG